MASNARPTVIDGTPSHASRTAVLHGRTMTMISEAPRVRRSTTPQLRSSPERPRRSVFPAIVDGDGPVVALRPRPVIAHGALASRRELRGERLVSGYDLSARQWWIPARAVWTDAESAERPEHPWAIGQVTDTDSHRAVLAGLSDRLGWEAQQARQQGHQLSQLPSIDPRARAVIYDGRLGHDVPTVVVVDERFVRWGAGVTLESAYHRAMFGDRGTLHAERELGDLELVLAGTGVTVAVVDLGTPLLREAGVHRVSVQLLAPSHDPVRRWDGDPLD